jgi:hypothetical protein
MQNKLKKLTHLQLADLKINKPVKIIVGLFAFYLLFSYFAVNPIAKKMVPWLAEKQLASQASVGRVAFDPFRLKTTIENFNLNARDGKLLAGFEKLVVDFEASGLFDWAWKFQDVSIVAPKVNVFISPNGKLNWADLIAKLNEDPSPPNDAIPRVVVNHFSMQKGDIQYEDANRPTPFKAGLVPLDFALDGFSTLPKDRGDYLISAQLPDQGGTLKWKGTVAVNPMHSTGNVSVAHIQLAKLLQVIKGVALPVNVTQGEMGLDFVYDFSLLDKVTQRQSSAEKSLTSTKNTKDVANVSSSSAQPKVLLNHIALALNNVQGTLVQAGNVSAKQVKVSLPQLYFLMQDAPQLHFQDLQLKVSDISLDRLNGQTNERLFSLPQFDVNHVAFNLSERHLKVGQVLLVGGQIDAIRNQAGEINWQQAFAPAETQLATTLPENTVDKVNSTHVEASETTSAPATESDALMKVEIADVQLQHWQLHIQDQSFAKPLQLNVADFSLGLAINLADNGLDVQQIQSQLSDLSLKSSLSTAPVATLDKISVQQGLINLKNQKIALDSVLISGLKTSLIKEANKPLNWQQILAPNNLQQSATSKQIRSNANKNAPEKASSDWALSLKKLALENASVHIEDRSLITPLKLDIEKIGAEIQLATLDLTQALAVKAGFKVKQGGQFNVQGKVTPQPLKADLNLKLSDFALKPFSTYINQIALLKLHEGDVDVAGKLSVRDGKNLALAFNGGFSINQLSIKEELGEASFLSWDKVSSEDLEFKLSPNQLNIASLDIVKPNGKFIIHEDKTMNVTRILRNQSRIPDVEVATPQASKTSAIASNSDSLVKNTLAAPTTQADKVAEKVPAPTVAEVREPDFPVRIETIRVKDAEIDFADLSLTPQFGTHINSLTGVVNGVSNSAESIAQLELDGKVDEYGAARVRGSIQPFNATNFTDIKLGFKNLEMNRLTPYSGKFAGRRIDSGKLSVDLEYKIKQRQLAGENKFIMNKLVLGEKVESSDAADLPLDLAIAILEDSDGVIDLDLPISGSLDDPKFSYGSIVWKAIKNVLTKIVTAPFRALGKLFGGSGENLEAITFEPGYATLLPPELEKLKAVSEALKKRQGLSLGVIPSVDIALDKRALQEMQIRRKVAEEMGVKLSEGQPLGPIDFTNPKTQKAIDALHDTLTKKSLFKKLASKLEKPKAGHFEEALEQLIVSEEVTEEALQALAKSRGEIIQKTLLENGVATDSVHVEAAVKNTASGKTINTKLTLGVKDTKKVSSTSNANNE